MNWRYFVISLCVIVLLQSGYALLHEIPSEPSFILQNVTRSRRQASSSKCSSYEFKCNSGECLSDSFQCDGIEHCRDGSDETNCENVPCPSFSFRCAYGACINSDFVCDGKKDCRDNSDETNSNCTSSNSGAACSLNQFRCTSGQCINEDLVCDGKTHCRDKSDETKAVCSELTCPGYTFRCDYGACVNGNARCNGKRDCADGSDENPTLCNNVPSVSTERPTSKPDTNGCVLPQYPNNGQYTIFGSNANYSPGDIVSSTTVLDITCNTGYRAEPNISITICTGSKWAYDIPKCTRTCATIPLKDEYNVQCSYRNSPVSCENPYRGTTAKYECKPLYEDLNLQNNPYRRCEDGSWDYSPPSCLPKCGSKRAEAQILVVGGVSAKKGDYPWVAALYKGEALNHICGGSIITQKTILTAAHCVSDSNGKVYSEDLFSVAVGKYYRLYSDPRDLEAQYSKVKKIHTSIRYTGITSSYAYDIAVLELKVKLTLTDVVQPVCVDWTNIYENEQLQANSFGIVTGWGTTKEDSGQAEELKELEVPYIPEGSCQNDIPLDFRKYFTLDKICSGYLQEKKSACKGDSGGGLVFKLRKEREYRYYIRGIVSVSPRSGDGCDSNQYTLYTKVSSHMNFLNDVLSKIK